MIANAFGLDLQICSWMHTKIIIPENNFPMIKDPLLLKIFKAGIIPNNRLGNIH